MEPLSRYDERDRDRDLERDRVHDLRGDLLPLNEGDLAEDVLALVGRSILVPFRGDFDAVAFKSEPDSMISPSEGVAEDLDLSRDAILPTIAPKGAKRLLGKRSFS